MTNPKQQTDRSATSNAQTTNTPTSHSASAEAAPSGVHPAQAASPVLETPPQPGPVLTAREALGPAGVVPLSEKQPPAKIIIDPPLPGPLARGRVVIQYRTENLRIEPVFGPAALDVSPRAGHLHITVDDSPWHWLDASGETLTITGLSVGLHKILIELVNANHQTLDYEVVSVNVPERSLVPADPKADGFRKAPPIPGVVP